MMRWWWLSFSDNKRPVGQQALGCVIIRAAGFDDAVKVCHRRGIVIDAQIDGAMIDEAWGSPPALFIGRLLTREEADELSKKWDPQKRGLASPEHIRAAFLDDDAKEGDPLFKERKS